MIDLQDKNNSPALEEIGEYVCNPVFRQFCLEIMDTYKCHEKIEYSSCSWVLVVVGNKEKPLVEEILPECTVELQSIYHETREGNSQKQLVPECHEFRGVMLHKKYKQIFCIL